METLTRSPCQGYVRIRDTDWVIHALQAPRRLSRDRSGLADGIGWKVEAAAARRGLARAQPRRAVDGREARFTAVASLLIGAEPSSHTSTLPESHRLQNRSTNPLERVKKGIKRPTAGGDLPDPRLAHPARRDGSRRARRRVADGRRDSRRETKATIDAVIDLRT